jgi:hypothetical protein
MMEIPDAVDGVVKDVGLRCPDDTVAMRPLQSPRQFRPMSSTGQAVS